MATLKNFALLQIKINSSNSSKTYLDWYNRTTFVQNFVFLKQNSHIQFKPLSKGKHVKKILAIRLQATGDVVISLPYLQSLKEQLPKDVVLDLMVREECKVIPQHLTIFNRVHVLQGGRNSKWQLFFFLLMLPKLWWQGYDVLMDLQNHRLSKVMRRLLRVKVFCVFDRTSTDYAGDRYRNTINTIGFPTVQFQIIHSFKNIDARSVLAKFNLENVSYVVINPGGAFANRNWELSKYVDLCNLWKKEMDSNTKFLLLGISKISEQATFFENELGSSLINLVNKTTQIEALVLLSKARVVISEDSGLFHMSYAVGTPTIGIFGSTRNDWTNPNLPHTYCFNSSDLPCGNCMLEICIYSDIRCLTRVKPSQVMNEARKLLNLNGKEPC
jgi:heptosyltransferase II